MAAARAEAQCRELKVDALKQCALKPGADTALCVSRQVAALNMELQKKEEFMRELTEEAMAAVEEERARMEAAKADAAKEQAMVKQLAEALADKQRYANELQENAKKEREELHKKLAEAEAQKAQDGGGGCMSEKEVNRLAVQERDQRFQLLSMERRLLTDERFAHVFAIDTDADGSPLPEAQQSRPYYIRAQTRARP